MNVCRIEYHEYEYQTLATWANTMLSREYIQPSEDTEKIGGM